MQPYVHNNISKNHSKRNPDSTRNVINMGTTILQPCLLLVSRSSDHVISSLPHVATLVFHLYTIIYEQVFYEFIQSIVENAYDFPLELP
jgi:hypothetical protein